ncbi:MAG: peptide deformylase [Candidatus Kapabacteria bacterium]|nr:peptide deformylase [Candidatus Kapabacteria bacterium]
MAQLPIYNCFHPVLRKKTNEINEINDNIVKFINDMIDTMVKADGAGLAANQVGNLNSIIVIDQKIDEKEPKGNSFVLVNPKIVSFGEKVVPFKEGCLSIPTFFESVIRPDDIEIEYYDIDMKLHSNFVSKRLARVIQHEIDHLNGILFYDRITPLRRSLSKNKIRKIERLDFKARYPMINPDGSFLEATIFDDEEEN